MILLFWLFLKLSRGAPLSSPATNFNENYVPLTLRETVLQTSSSTRTVWDILWSCVLTIFACTWSALHPNIPGPYDSGWRSLKRRVVTMLYALMAPEMVIVWALIQYKRAREVMIDYNEIMKCPKPGQCSILESVEDWFLSVPPKTNQQGQGVQPWTMTQGFFVQMGGFLLYDDGKPVQVLTYKRLKQRIADGTIDPPDITTDEIQDRSKGDFISKGLIILQTSWFILQCITRWSQRLPLSELEVVTLGFALLNGITYVLWWHKPQSVGKAFRVAKKNPDSELQPKATLTAVAPEKEPSISEAVESPDEGPASQIPADLTSIVHMDVPVNRPNEVKLVPSGGTAEIIDDGKQPDLDKPHTPRNPQSTTTNSKAGVPDVFRIDEKVKFLPRMLKSDYAKVDGSWSSVAWFYGVMVPFRVVHCWLYVVMKMADSEPVSENALRVPMFVSEYVEISSFWPGMRMYLAFGTVFGGVHLIAWPSMFPTQTEKLLWCVSAVYISSFPTVVFLGTFFTPTLTKLSLVDHVGHSVVWMGAGIYGVARFILIFEAFLTLRNLPPAVYQDIEWTTFIPHL